MVSAIDAAALGGTRKGSKVRQWAILTDQAKKFLSKNIRLELLMLWARC